MGTTPSAPSTAATGTQGKYGAYGSCANAGSGTSGSKGSTGATAGNGKDMEREPVPAVQMVHQAVKGKMVVVTIVPAVKAALVHLVGQVVLAVQQAKVHQES